MSEASNEIEIPRDRLEVRFSRSGGPGGQNVNKVETRVEVRLRLADAEWIPEAVKERLRQQRRNRITQDDELIVVSSRHREQRRNLEDCIGKLQEWLRQASRRPRTRRKTRPTRASVERRLSSKRRRGEIKKARQSPPDGAD